MVATLVPTIIEYFVGWLADKLLHVRLWDYSGMPLNLNGYVCLLFSLVWGLACLFIVAVFHPMVLHLLAWVPTIPGWILLALFTATILTDFILTALEAAKIPKRLQAIDELERGLRRLSDSIGSNLSEHTLELWDKGQEKLRPEKREEFWNSLGSRKREFMAQRDEILEKYHALLERPGRVYTHLLKAFPHLRQTEMHLRLERIWELYRQRRNKK